MVDVIGVTLWGENIGALSWDNDRNLGSFEFQPSFLSKALNVSPIHMPISGSKGKIYNFPSELKKAFCSSLTNYKHIDE